MSDESAYYVDLVNRLLATHDYDWARKTLTGIASTMEQTGNCTARQREAIEHVIVGKLKHDAGKARG